MFVSFLVLVASLFHLFLVVLRLLLSQCKDIQVFKGGRNVCICLVSLNAVPFLSLSRSSVLLAIQICCYRVSLLLLLVLTILRFVVLL